MNAFTSIRDVAPVDAHPAAAQSGHGSIRALLRDTALLVTTLTQGGRAAPDLRDRCVRLVEHFQSSLQHLGCPDDVRDDAVLAQCGLLDEKALACLDGVARDDWAARPLQIQLLGIHDAGERMFRRLDSRAREAGPNVALLECYAAVLALGFTGRYVLDGVDALDDLAASLNDRLRKLRPVRDEPFVIEIGPRRSANWLCRLSPWALAGGATVIALTVWCAWQAVLAVQLAHLLSKSSH